MFFRRVEAVSRQNKNKAEEMIIEDGTAKVCPHSDGGMRHRNVGIFPSGAYGRDCR
jgi:hypothetical protein